MPLTWGTRTISSVEVIDDDPGARNALALQIADADLRTVDVAGPIRSLSDLVASSLRDADAAVCDHKLGIIGSYAGFNGSQAVAQLYNAGFPALLCTNWGTSDIDTIRRDRRRIPVLMRPDDVDPDAITEGIILCLRELNGDYPKNRKPWRTLVRVEEVAEQVFYVVLPGWSSKERVRLPIAVVPRAYQDKLGEDTRFHAKVNLGAEDPHELYFEEIEFG